MNSVDHLQLGPTVKMTPVGHLQFGPTVNGGNFLKAVVSGRFVHSLALLSMPPGTNVANVAELWRGVESIPGKSLVPGRS